MKTVLFRYRKSILGSLIVHTVLIAMLILNFQTLHKIKLRPSIAKPEPVKIIQAVALDEKAVQKEITRLALREKNALRLNQKIQKQVNSDQQKIASMQKQAKQEQQKIASMKKQAKQEQQKIASMKKQAKLEQQKIAKIKKQAQKTAVAEKQKIARLKKQAQRAAQQAKKLKAALDKEQAQLKAQLALAKKQQAEKRLREKQRILDRKVDAFLMQVKDKIEQNRQLMLHFPSKLSVTIRFFLLPNGAIRDLSVTQSSGNLAYDDSSLTAVRKTVSFTEMMPTDKEVLKRVNGVIHLELKNEHSV